MIPPNFGKGAGRKRRAPNTPKGRQLDPQAVAEYASNFANPYIAARRGYVDDIIEPSETRPRLITAFERLRGKRVSLPKKKHGNIPL